VAAWNEWTPGDFVFDVKAFRLATMHQTPPAALPKDVRATLPASLLRQEVLYYNNLPEEVRQELWQRFLRALVPLAGAGKLGALLFQFPPWFTAERRFVAHLQHIRHVVPDHTIAVEFRHPSWLSEEARERTLALLRELQFAFVTVDEPQGLPNSVPLLPAVTLPRLAILRLHGRNREMWSRKGVSVHERYDYLYTQEELAELLPVIARLGDMAEEVHIAFNNNNRDYAQRNGLQLQELLGLRQGTLPLPHVGRLSTQ